MKLVLFLVASLASASQLASAETAHLRASASSLIDAMDDAIVCMNDCNSDDLGKKSRTKTKRIRKSLTECYNSCFFHSDGTKTSYGRSLGSARTEEILECSDKCARKAEKDVKKAEKSGNKDSKKYTRCLDDCDEEEDKKKCTKKCDKDEDKRAKKDEEKAMKSAQKSADKCTDRCVTDGLFAGDAMDAMAMDE